MSADDALWRADTTTSPDDDAAVEELVEDIEQTRGELADTAEELGRRLSPGALIDNAKETARDATVGKVEAMATSAGEMVSDVGYQARETGNGIVETIRRNPVPAALAGVGLAWLWMSRTPSSRRPTRVASVGPHGTAYRTDAQPSAGDAVGDAVDAANRKFGQAQRSASDAVESFGRTADDMFSDARQAAEQVAPRLQSTADDLADSANRIVEDNPLAVGAVALAVGTAVGLALPATRTERQLMGDAGQRVLGQAQEAMAGPLEDAERAIRQSESRVTAGTSA